MKSHPLPWTLPGRDWVHLEPDTAFCDGEPKPYKLRLGPDGRDSGGTSYSASFSEAELLALRGHIDDVLAARFRVLVLGGHGVPAGPLTLAVHRRLDMLRSWHPRLEVAVVDDTDGAGPGDAAGWCTATQVPVLRYLSAATATADGGNRALVARVAGEGNQTPNWAAHVAAFRAFIPHDWITITPAGSNSGGRS